MNKTNIEQITEKRLLNLHELMTYIGAGKNSALDFAKKANAQVDLGIRRALYDKKKVDAYIDSLLED